MHVNFFSARRRYVERSSPFPRQPRLQMLVCVGYVRPLVDIKPARSAKPSEQQTSRLGRALSSIFSNEIAVGKRPIPYKKVPEGKIFEILRVRNRFAMDKGSPNWSGGFRDLAFKIKVGFQVPSLDASLNSSFRNVRNV